jgi:Polysaccharide deacetylase.
MRALVSIHDLMPETMDRVERILLWLQRRQVPPCTLLVVPGKDWTPQQIKRLQSLAATGHTLAAHGWHHHTQPRKLYHRLHALFISRNVAEHLDLDSKGVLELLQRSHGWFAKNDLPEPDFYVPPAWALGPISKEDLAACPFTRIETTRGILFPVKDGSHRRVKLPLTGFEADTKLRAAFLRRWNQYETKRAQKTDTPLRISIHPDDLDLMLRDQMEALFKISWEYISEDAIS